MTQVIDPEIEAVASQLWPEPRQLQVATGGLFNRVVRVVSPSGVNYLKRLTDAASSGDFPPLPTSAEQRCLVASTWHDLASRASAREPRVGVPKLLALESAVHVIAMDEAQGRPLYEALLGDGEGAAHCLRAVASWLGALHGLPLYPRQMLLAASEPFKAFKIDLQYTRVLAELPLVLHDPCRRFIQAYLRTTLEPVHGDLNSRNIMCADGAVSVIDFEQGHFGEGIYDLAYLLSEYVIRDLKHGVSPEPAIEIAWTIYSRARGMRDDASTFPRLRVHLAFQTLYRLVGPSRQVWTAHLADASKDVVRKWSIAELSAWLR